MTAIDFRTRIEELRTMTGSRDGWLRGEVEVNQVYAHYQHERADLQHPRGGQAFYLRDPLLANYDRYLRDYAATVLDDGGQHALERSMEDLAGVGGVETHAPREWGDLLKSGHPRVWQGLNLIYDRLPKAARLSEEELAAKSRAILRMRLAAGLTVYFMRNGKVMVIPGRNEPHALRGRL